MWRKRNAVTKGVWEEFFMYFICVCGKSEVALTELNSMWIQLMLSLFSMEFVSVSSSGCKMNLKRSTKWDEERKKYLIVASLHVKALNKASSEGFSLLLWQNISKE